MSKTEWPALCGVNDSAIWDTARLLNTTIPTFTRCFQDTVLIWFPCGIFLLTLPFYLPYLNTWETVNKWKDKGRWQYIKLISTCILIAVCIIELLWVATRSEPFSLYLSPLIKIITFVFGFYVTHKEFAKGFHTSGPLFFLWFTYLICTIFPFYSYILDESITGYTIEPFLKGTFYTSFILVLALFIFSLFSDLNAFQYEKVSTDSEKTPLLGNKVTGKGNGKEPCPEKHTSFINNILHTWITGHIIDGYKRNLVFEDLYDIMERDKSKSIVALAEPEWEQQTKGIEYQSGQLTPKDLKKPSYVKVLLKANEFGYYMAAFVRLVLGFAEYLNPILLNVVIAWVTSDDIFEWKGYTLAAILFFVNVFVGVLIHYYFKFTYTLGMRCRTAVITMVYRKSLRLSHSSRRTTTVGEIVNLMSVDSQRISDFVVNIHEWWAAPIFIVVCMYLLWGQVGPSSLAGLALLVCMAPVNGGYVMAQFTKLQEQQMKFKDERIKVLNEVLAGIKVLKMYAWEPSFREKIGVLRNNELRLVRKMAWINGLVAVTWFCTPYLVSLAIFTVYVLSNPENYLDPTKAFVTVTLINFLNWFVGYIPVLLSQGSQAYVSIKRITKFLLQEEVDTDSVNYIQHGSKAVSVKDGEFAWEKDADKSTLKNINFSIEEGKLVAIVGTVGTGKSSLLNALLGEMHKLQGNVTIKGQVAYVPQQAWIQNMTVKENILFGKSLKEDHYKKVVEACALEPDFKILPGGDATEIGEKGINLSGGQKQRVSLARAVYQNNDLYLLDDPLSAVDAHVGKHIFEKVIGPKGLLRNKTRVLVTHGITYLPNVDMIITMNNGEVSEVGTYDELIKNDGAFAEFIRTYSAEKSDDSDDDVDTKTVNSQLSRQISTLSQDDTKSNLSNKKPSRARRRTVSRQLSIGSTSSRTEAIHEKKGPTEATLVEEEVAEIGAIKLSVIKEYIEAAGYTYLIVTLLSWAVYVASQVGVNLWLSLWSDDPILNGTVAKEQTSYRLGVYAGIGMGQMFALFFLSMGVFLGGVVASRVMHLNLLNQILHAPMSFFDTTPLGRIVNRFSTDMDKLDNNIPLMTRWWCLNVATCVAVIVAITYSTPIFLTVVIPLAVIYFFLQKVYIKTVRQLKRIDSIRRSPIYVNFDETLVGVTCIRAFKRQEDFIANNDRLTDNSQIAWYPVLVSFRWLGILLDSLGALVVFFATVFAVLSRDVISGGLVGLSVSFSMQITFSINMMVRGASELETHVISLERIKEYTDIDSEAPWENEDTKPKDSWPEQGQVDIKNYSTRYRPGLDLVLKGMTFSARPAEKVGIVGRTGAGKSSMALSLFRIIESAGGQIVIDGVNIADIGLHDLRSKLTIIPQDPVIFSGSLRQNLDPFDNNTDNELWKALELSHLKKFVSDLKEGLDYECGEGGEALSAGQRQLVCLARALLRKTRILILDEATAAVDMETDDLIQTTIRTAFKDYTVLTVAHRLNTILDYDRVIVLSEGIIKECDSPSALLENKETIFHGMAKDAGIL